MPANFTRSGDSSSRKSNRGADLGSYNGLRNDEGKMKMETINRIQEIKREAEEIVEIAEGSDKNFAWVLGEGVEIAVKSGKYSTYEIGILIEHVGKTYVAVNEWRVSQGMKEV